jgi:hypothetical protein
VVSGAIGNLDEIRKAISKKAQEYEFIPEDLGDTLADNFAYGPSPGVGTAYLRRLFKPTAFGGNLPWLHLFDRISINQEFQLGATAPIPIPGAPGVFGLISLNYNKLITDSVSETYSTSTFLYALMFGIHEYAILDENHINRTKTLVGNPLWEEIKVKQEAYFKKVFRTYGDGLRQNPPTGHLLTQMNAIAKEVAENPNIERHEKSGFIRALDEFEAAVKDYAYEPAHYQDQDKYHKAIAAFEKFILAYSPHWFERRLHAAFIKPGYLPKLEITETQKMIEQRRREAVYHEISTSPDTAEVWPEYIDYGLNI